MVGETTDPGLNVTGALEQQLRWGGEGGRAKSPSMSNVFEAQKSPFQIELIIAGLIIAGSPPPYKGNEGWSSV